jgi:hypothetical protein
MKINTMIMAYISIILMIPILLFADETQFHPTKHQQAIVDSIGIFTQLDKFDKVKSLCTALKPEDPVDATALVEWILRTAYTIATEDLDDVAQQIEHFNSLKKELRGYIEETQDYQQKLMDELRNKYNEEHGTLEGVESALKESVELQQIKEEVQKREIELQIKEEESEALSLKLQLLTERRAQMVQNVSEALDIDENTRQTMIDNIK